MKWQLLTHQMESMAFSENQMGWLEDFMKEASRRFESPLKLDTLEKDRFSGPTPGVVGSERGRIRVGICACDGQLWME